MEYHNTSYQAYFLFHFLDYRKDLRDPKAQH